MERFPTKQCHLFDDAGHIDRLEVLKGPSGRRTWPDDAKVRIVMESYAPGANVCDVARRHGMFPQHLSTSRGLAKMYQPSEILLMLQGGKRSVE
ncbi:transposase [Roseobacter weihaiensis]|uniref:transposase n=1 Tax=Roseobacter weihaiensis TaxID=2763262 RepID=UPI001D0BAA33|nr:transposase [Roseobacter sp. H9]